jgi:hypothetical protein
VRVEAVSLGTTLFHSYPEHSSVMGALQGRIAGRDRSATSSDQAAEAGGLISYGSDLLPYRPAGSTSRPKRLET